MSDFANVEAKNTEKSTQIDGGLLDHMSSVYKMMSVGLLITFAAAWAIASLAVTGSPSEGATMLREGEYLTSFGELVYNSPLIWLIMFAPLIYILVGFSRKMMSMSAAAVQTGFYVFAGLMGLSLSSIFLVYTSVSIVQVFLITSIAFAGLSLWGYTTKKDISGWGSFLFMGLIGLIAAMILNIFIGSSALDFAISVIGLLIFSGLTAYDTQKVKNLYLHYAHEDGETLGKLSVMGAMELYLDFINIFMFLLDLFGQKD